MSGKRVGRWCLVMLVVLLMLPGAAGAQGVPPDPGLAGPYPVAQFNFTLTGTGATVFYPGTGGVVAAGGPFPGLVLGHGFARSRGAHAGNGAFFASHGFIVVTVDFPNPLAPDYTAWAAKISAALDWLEAQNADPASSFWGQVATDRFGVLGHSAGGMATWVAAGQDTRIRAIMPLDPVPASGADLSALGAGLTMPAAWSAAPASSCNASASYVTLYPLTVAAQKAQYVAAGATHCDFEDPTDFTCTLFCGSASSARRQVIRRYVVAWLRYYLRAEANYFHYVHGDGLVDDLAAGRLDSQLTQRNTEPQGATAAATALGGAVQLAWQPYPVLPLAGYNLYRRPLAAPTFEPLAQTGMFGSYDDAGLPAGTYEYALAVRDTLGNEQQRRVLPPLTVSCYRFDVAPAECDGLVDLLDIQAVAGAWPLASGQPGYEPRFDVDNSGTIDILDIGLVTAAWNWPP